MAPNMTSPEAQRVLETHREARLVRCRQCKAPEGHGCRGTSRQPVGGWYVHVIRREDFFEALLQELLPSWAGLN
jgi:hypothetical protein